MASNLIFPHLRAIHFRTTVLVSLTSLLLACSAPQKMPFAENNGDYIREKPGSLMLMTATYNNTYDPKLQSHQLYVRLEKRDNSKEKYAVEVNREDKARKSSLAEGSKFLIRFQLAPGKYRLLGLDGTGEQPPFITASYFMPIHVDFEVPANGTVYLGNVSGSVRKRDDGDVVAGEKAVLYRPRRWYEPEISLEGFSLSTFDVTLIDRYEQDIEIFKRRFSQLADRTIEKRLLSQPTK